MCSLLPRALLLLALISSLSLANQDQEQTGDKKSGEQKHTLRAYWGETVPAKITASEDYIKERCDEGSYINCLLLSAANFRSHYDDQPYKQAFTNLEKDCNNGNAPRCLDLGLLYGYEEYVEADPAKARDYVTKACKAKYLDGCFALATMVATGTLESSKDNEALNIFNKTCTEKHAQSCAALANNISDTIGGSNESPSKEDVQAIYKFLQRACNYGDTPSCYQVGKLYLDDSFEFAIKDVAKAITSLDQACRANLSLACGTLIDLYDNEKHNSKDLAKKFEYSSLGCEQDDPYSCAELAYQYQFAEGVSREMQLSIKFSKKACDIGVKDNCISLGEYYRDGEFVNQDANLASTYFKQGCEDNASESCDEKRDYIQRVANNLPLDDIDKLEVEKAMADSVLVKKTFCTGYTEYGECMAYFEPGKAKLSATLQFLIPGDEVVSINPSTFRVNTLKINQVDARKNREYATNFSAGPSNNHRDPESQKPVGLVLSIEDGFNSINDVIELDASVIANTSSGTETLISKPINIADFHSFSLGPATFKGTEFKDLRYGLEYAAKSVKGTTKNDIDTLVTLIRTEKLSLEYYYNRSSVVSILEQQGLDEQIQYRISELFRIYTQLDQISEYRQPSIDEDGSVSLYVDQGARQIKKVILLHGDQELGVSHHDGFLRLDEDEYSSPYFSAPTITDKVRIKVVYWKDPKLVKVNFKLTP